MRSLTLALVFMVGCASSPPEGPSPAADVRDRLATPTKLLLVAPDSSGSVVARRYVNSSWQSGTIALALNNGELDVAADAAGQLAITELAVGVAPITIPKDVFGKEVQLRDVRVTLADKLTATTRWADANTARASAMVALDLGWTLYVDGNAAPLGTQHLGPLPITIALSGDGAEVDATLSLQGSGMVWKWADLIELDDLQLALGETTAF
jgi:hypothetical protein